MGSVGLKKETWALKQENWALTNEIGVKQSKIEVEGWKGENMFGDGLIQLNCTS